jgi:hypothetical protein
MLFNYSKIQFPIWQYLNQPLFEKSSRTVLNPRRFWYVYQIERLERCFAKGCASQDSNRD